MTAEYENRKEIKEELKADAQKANQALFLETERLTTSTPTSDEDDKNKTSTKAGDKDTKEAGEEKLEKPIEGPIPPPPPGPDYFKENLRRDLRAQYEAAVERLELLKKRESVDYYKVNKTINNNGEETAGRYFTESKHIEVYNSEKPLKTVVAHERRHRDNDFATFTASDGKTYKALNAPMGLVQRHKLTQADEIGAYITEVLTLRQEYIEADEQGQKKLVAEMENDERFGWYFKGVKSGRYDPLSKDSRSIKHELDSIGGECASRWKRNLYNSYSEALKERTEGYFKESRFQDVKPNNDNYNKALSAMLTIGGHDFSSSVKGSLTTDTRFSKIDEALNGNANKCDVIDEAAKVGIKLGEKDDSLEKRMAAYLVKGKQTTGQEVALGEGEYVWTEEMLNAVKTAKNSYVANCKQGVYSQEQMQECDEKWNKLNSIKIGDKGSNEEYNAMNDLIHSFDYRTKEGREVKFPLIDVINEANFQQSNSLVTDEEKSAYKKAYDKVKREGDEAFEKIALGDIKQRVNEFLSGKEYDKPDKSLSEYKVKEYKEYRDSNKTTRPIRSDDGEKEWKIIPNFSAPILDPDYDRKLSDAQKRVADLKKRLEELEKAPEELNKKQPQASNTSSSQDDNKTESPNLVALLKERTGRC